jgi:hypothetical protein
MVTVTKFRGSKNSESDVHMGHNPFTLPRTKFTEVGDGGGVWGRLLYLFPIGCRIEVGAAII